MTEITTEYIGKRYPHLNETYIRDSLIKNCQCSYISDDRIILDCDESIINYHLENFDETEKMAHGGNPCWFFFACFCLVFIGILFNMVLIYMTIKFE